MKKVFLHGIVLVNRKQILYMIRKKLEMVMHDTYPVIVWVAFALEAHVMREKKESIER